MLYILGLLLVGLMLPAMMLLIPQFLLAKKLMLLDSLWGPGWSEEHLVEVHVGNLRRKLSRLGPDGLRAPIRTVRGVGYRMEEPEAF